MRRLLPDPVGEVSDEDLAAAHAYPEAGPWVRANMVSTADGAASREGRSGGISGAADKRLFAVLRGLADAVLVGAGTARTEGYGPARAKPAYADLRRRLGQAPAPVLALVSARLDLDPAAPLFAEAEQRPVVLTVEEAPADRRAALAAVADVVDAGEVRVDAGRAVDALAERGLPRVLCEGGPTLLAAVVGAGRLDELCLTLSPLLLAGTAPRVLAGPPVDAPLRLVRVHEDGGTLFLGYARAQPADP